MTHFNDDCRWRRVMWSIYVLSGMLSFITFVNISNGENQVAVSYLNTCVLSGTNVSCWGRGWSGVLGTGSTDDFHEPPTRLIDLGDDFITNAIDCGGYHCCSVSTNKTLKCWGHNGKGQLGQGDSNNRGDGPDEMGNNLSIIDLGSDFDVEHVSCGYEHTCVLSTNQSVKCFGYNVYGQLGNGNTDWIGDGLNEMGDDLSVISLGTDFIPIQVDCGGSHSCALSVDHQIKCWGYNWSGQLGQGDYTNRGNDINQMGDNLTPIDLGTGFNASSVRCGDWHVCALSTDHDTKCWGHNYYGQLGLGDANHRGENSKEMGNNLSVLNLGADFVPQRLGGGRTHNLALSVNGTIKAWGGNGYGQLGYGDTNDRGDEGNEMGSDLSLVDVGGGFTVTDISSNSWSEHSCALLENGTAFLGLKCWGMNDYGQLGLGDTHDRGEAVNEMGDDLPFISITFPALYTLMPSVEPTMEPTDQTLDPTKNPTDEPTSNPTTKPTDDPTSMPSADPSLHPTDSPTVDPTDSPITDTEDPTTVPSESPTVDPTVSPTTIDITESPTSDPTTEPTSGPTVIPTMEPTSKCEPYRNCTECTSFNFDSIPQCFWHISVQKCYDYNELNQDEMYVYEEEECTTPSPSTNPLDTELFQWILIVVAVMMTCIMVSVVLLFLWRRKLRVQMETGPEKQASNVLEMVSDPQHEVRDEPVEIPPGNKPQMKHHRTPSFSSVLSRGEGIEDGDENHTVTNNDNDV